VVRAPWAHSAASRGGALRSAVAGKPDVVAAAAVGDTTAAKLARVEAILFLSREPLPSRKLAALADLADGTEARSLVRELARRLRIRGSAFQPVEVAHGVQLLTRPQLADWLTKVHAPAAEMRLSAPALETLAVCAYRQPVTRAEIEAIRGVQCGEILRVLMERDFLRIVGRSEELGRPFLYGTTRKFLQVFGLRRLEQLPPVDQIRNAASLAA
jgi:segregation and condensation protein B